MSFDLNNRELATATLALGALVFCLCSKNLRNSLCHLAKCALQWKLVLTALVTWAVAAAGVWMMIKIGLWNDSLIKDTIVWGVFSGVAIAFRGISEADPNSKFRSLVADQFKGVVVFEFLINAYSMSYPAELIWLVLTIIVTLFIAVGGTDEKNRPAVNLFKFFQGILGLWMVGFILFSLWQKPSEVMNTGVMQAFLLPIFLAIWVLPLGYLVSVLAGYEQVFLRQKIGQRQPLDLRLYSQFRTFELGGLNSSRIRRIGTLLGPRIGWPKNHEEADQLFLALSKTMEDPMLDESGDFVWPPPDPQFWSSSPSIESISEYRQRIDPLFAKLMELEKTADRLITVHLPIEESQMVLVNSLHEKIAEVEDTVEIASNLPNLAPRVRKLDRRFQDYVASVDNLYRMATQHDDRSWESWCASVQLFSGWCREAREKFEKAISQFALV